MPYKHPPPTIGLYMCKEHLTNFECIGNDRLQPIIINYELFKIKHEGKNFVNDRFGKYISIMIREN
jgi:hypothetical protein